MNSTSAAIKIAACSPAATRQISNEVIAVNVQLLIEQLEAGHSEGLGKTCGCLSQAWK